MPARSTYVKTASGWEQIATSIQAVPQGLVPIAPSSVSGGSFTGDGLVSFSTQRSITVSGVFSASFDNYLVQFVGQSSNNGANLQLRFASGGTSATGDAWAYGGNSLNTAAIAFATGSASSNLGIMSPLSNNNATANFAKIEIASPFLASEKIVQAQNVGHTTQYSFWASNSTFTSRDGFVLFMSGGTFTGSLRVYGYSKGGSNQPQAIQPFSAAAGFASLVGTGSSSATTTVTFPVGRFSQTPVISVSAPNAAISISAVSATSSGFTIGMRHIDAGNIGSTYSTPWQAMQMTSASAGG